MEKTEEMGVSPHVHAETVSTAALETGSAALLDRLLTRRPARPSRATSGLNVQAEIWAMKGLDVDPLNMVCDSSFDWRGEVPENASQFRRDLHDVPYEALLREERSPPSEYTSGRNGSFRQLE